MKINRPFRFGHFLDLPIGPRRCCSNSHFARLRAGFTVQNGNPNDFGGQDGLPLMPGKAGNPAGGAVHSVGVAVQNPS